MYVFISLVCQHLSNFEIFRTTGLMFNALISEIVKNQNVQIDTAYLGRKVKKIPVFSMEQCFSQF